MPGWNHANIVWIEKTCPACGELFQPNSGSHKFCSDACRGKWKYMTGTVSTETQYEKISGNWFRYFSRLAANKNGLSAKELCDKLDEQNGLCALTGIELTCKLEKGVICKTNASIDRIVAGGPYIPENIQLVCTAVNGFRKDLSVDEFVWWCTKVAGYFGRG